MKSKAPSHAEMLLALAAVTAAWAACFFRYDGAPFEDAAMLLRYAQHWAQGQGIVWNVGERPLDGATDFGLLALVAFLQRLGLDGEQGVRWLSVAAHVATVLLLYWAPQAWLKAPRWAAALAALCYALGPGPAYVEAYFGTPVFAFALALAWALGLRAALGREEGGAMAFGAASLAAGLIRPEGVILSFFLLLVLLPLAPRRWRSLAGAWALWVLLLGGIYFLWHWSYFGHPLPNPFYKKGGGRFYARSAWGACLQSAAFLGPSCVVFVAALCSRQRVLAAATLAFLLAASLLWGLLSDEMNYLGRFQYPLMAVGLLVLPVFLGLWEPGQLPQGQRAAALVLLLALACYWPFLGRGRQPRAGDGRADVGRALQAFSGRGYSMAVTEAGLLPYYSRWKALDAWGLNDAVIARRGALAEEDLNALAPDLIMVHAYFPPDEAPARAAGWDGMCVLLYRWAREHRYRLAALYGPTKKDVHAYFLRPGLPDEAGLLQALRAQPYRWYASGEPVQDWAP